MPLPQMPQIPKQKLFLIIGGVLALVAIIMTKIEIDRRTREAQRKAQRYVDETLKGSTSVLVAKLDIPRGAEIDSSMLEPKVFPKEYVRPQAVTALDRIAGMMTMTAIPKGEQITLGNLAYVREAGGLSEVTPIGKRAIAVSVDNISSMAGMLKAGDYVDVIALMQVQMAEGKPSQLLTLPLFQNVLVLAVGQETRSLSKQAQPRYRQEEKVPAAPLITLALSPQEVNLIAFVQDQGKIRLTLRSPTDTKIEPVQPASWDTLLQYVMPKVESKGQEKKKEEPQAVGYVEIYRGLSKERVPLYK